MKNVITRNIEWIYAKCASRFYRRDRNLWVFGEWLGKRCCDNSLYFANYVAVNYPEIKCVWIAFEKTDLSLLHPRVKRVVMDTPESKEVLKHAAVAVMNMNMVDFSANMDLYSSSAITVNLWHGVPWKKIGKDALDRSNPIKWIYAYYLLRLQRAKLYVALSDQFAEILHKTYYPTMKNIIKTGYPRNTIFYDNELLKKARDKISCLLREKSGLEVDEQTKIIVYMPTFRDKGVDVFSFGQMSQDERLERILSENNAIIVEKAHFVNAQKDNAKESIRAARVVNASDFCAQELMAASDLLITDYSSCFFDYLLLNRPIIHYLYDYDYYVNKDRGVYYKKEDVICGDAPETLDELFDAIETNLKEPSKNEVLRKQRRAQHITYETSESCKIIFDEINKRLR